MRLESIIRRMAPLPDALRALVGDLPEAEARFKPPSGAWSITEIVNHLADEEVEDFGMRVRMTLEDSSREWPPIDPEGWARERRYNERDLGESLARFAAARAESIAWLRSLASPDWGRVHEHPRIGRLTAGDLMTSWAAHDALHVRQIAKRLHDLAARDGEGFGVRYAGEW